MAPTDRITDTKSSITVIHRSKHDKNISDEPEMKELKRMIKNGELDQDKALERLKEDPDAKTTGQ
jgi:hypothetical protein